MRNLILFLTALSFSVIFSTEISAQAFVTTWQTDNTGTSASNEITIPTYPETAYNYDVSWEEVGNTTNNGIFSGNTGNLTITFPSAGIYRVSITGLFPRIYFNNAGDKDKLLSIEQWGNISWTSMERAFYGCSNLTSTAIDAPDLSLASSMLEMFAGATSFNSDLNNWAVSNINNMYGLFFQASSFNGDLSAWSVGNVTDMAYMFFGAIAFSQDLTNWNVSNVTTMQSMFDGATTFNGNISGWNVSQVATMNSMFNNASSFNSDISNWPIYNVTNMSFMFSGATAFNRGLSNWLVYASNMQSMFAGASSFNQSLGSWNISNVTNMTGMLDNSGLSTKNYDATLKGWGSSFSTPNGIALGAAGLTYCNGADSRTVLTGTALNWTITGDTYSCLPFITTWRATSGTITIPTTGGGYSYDISWTNLTNLEQGDGSTINPQTGNYTITNLNDGDVYQVSISGDFPRIYFQNFNLSDDDRSKILSIEQWGDQEWTNMGSAFYNCINLVSNATESPLLNKASLLNSMFSGATSFEGDLSNWDVSTIEDMSNMFEKATSFNSDLNSWDVSNVIFISSMFNSASSFNRDLNNWNVNNVNYMSSIFSGATSFNGDISSWELDNVISMNGMFADATSFNGDLSDWSVNNVSYMSRMFKGASAFKGDLSGWNVGNANRMNEMFADATSFNSDLSNWDVRNVREMAGMFYGATAFNGDLNNWNVAKVRNMGGMFWNATSFNQNLENWDISAVVPFEEESSGPIGIDSLFTNSGLSIFNYDSTLIGWATLSAGESQIPLNLNLGAQSLNYCFSEPERQELIDTYGWTILDNGANCPAPSTQATNISFANISVSQMNVSWTVGDGTSRLVIAKEGTPINANPVNLTTYSANSVFGTGEQIGSGNYVVYNGSGNSFTLSGLNENTTYHLRVYEYNGPSLLEDYNATTAAGNPTSQMTLAIPVISSFTPTSAGENQTVSIAGTGFTNVSLVSFAGVEATQFTVASDTVITATIGAGASGDVLVTTPGGTATLSGFVFIPAPTIASFTPTSAAQGDTVTIVGTDFTNASLVSFGGTGAASFNVISDTEIEAIVGTAASGDIRVTTAGGTANQANFTFIPTPVISAFAPSSAVQGDTVTIIGTGLTNASLVSFGETEAASFTVISDTEIEAIVATGASGNIFVATPGGTATKSGFVFIPAPKISAFTPTSAITGDTVTILGSGLKATSLLSFGGTEATSFNIISDSEITAIVGLGASGNVLVNTPGGTATKSGFVFIPAPTIASFTPISAAQSETVTITGTGLTNVSSVSFGGTGAASFNVISDTEITAVVGAGASGDVLVTNPGGTVTLSGFEFITAPVINSFSPLSAAQGTIITITGANLLAPTGVFFGGKQASSFAVISPNILTAVVGEGSSGDISVTTSLGNASISGFTFLSAQIALSSEENEEIVNNQSNVIFTPNTITGENKLYSFIISNTGNQNLSVSEVTSSNPAYEIQQYTELIAPGRSGNLTLNFKADSVGIYTSEIRMSNNSKQETFSFRVSAEVMDVNFINSENDIIILSNEDIQLGSTLTNVDLVKKFFIENKSNVSSIQINSISVDNPVFKIIDQPTSIAPLSTEEFSLSLVSATPGNYRGTLTVSTNINDFSFQVLGTVLKEELPDVEVVNLITPNGDKRHDFLFIENINLYPNNTVTIFNRWGNTLFTISKYNNTDRFFEGVTDNGEELLTGNYYYVIDKGNGDKRLNGFFFIQR